MQLELSFVSRFVSPTIRLAAHQPVFAVHLREGSSAVLSSLPRFEISPIVLSKFSPFLFFLSKIEIEGGRGEEMTNAESPKSEQSDVQSHKVEAEFLVRFDVSILPPAPLEYPAIPTPLERHAALFSLEFSPVRKRCQNHFRIFARLGANHRSCGRYDNCIHIDRLQHRPGCLLADFRRQYPSSRFPCSTKETSKSNESRRTHLLQ